jgi:hypothetical protein
MFVEDLLLELENAAVGFHLGNIYVGTPTCTCADASSDGCNNVSPKFQESSRVDVFGICTLNYLCFSSQVG